MGVGGRAMSEVFAFTFPGGRRNLNRTQVVFVNNTAKTVNITVPAGERWFLLWGKIINADDVARNCSVAIYDVDNAIIGTLRELAALAASGYELLKTVPGTISLLDPSNPVILEAGDYVNFYWAAGGASAGGTGYIYLVCLELDL